MRVLGISCSYHDAASTLGELLELRAGLNEKSPFALFTEAGGLTAGELNALADRISGRLLALGISVGSRVAVVAQTGPAQLATLAACWKAGAIVSPVDPYISPAGLGRLLSIFRPALVAIDPGHDGATALSAACSKAGHPTLDLRPDDWAASETPGRSAAEDDGAVCIFTSGSTGNPKGVLLSHRNLMAGALSVLQAKGIGPSDRAFCVLPLSHINGLVTTFVTPLLSGGSVVYLQKPFQQREALALMDEYQCTWFSAVPTHYAALMSPPVERDAWSLGTLRFCRSASAPLSARLLQQFEDYYGVPVIETMGMTETSGQIFSNPAPPAERRPGSVGLPINFDVRLVDEAGALCGDNEIGEIQVRGDSVMLGYLDDPVETAKVIDGGWLRSGDLAERDGEGYYHIRGRKKDIAIFCGVNISLRALETELQETNGMRDVACVAEEHPTFGETVVVYAVLQRRQGASTRVVQEISEALYPLLPNRLALSEIRFVSKLPRSTGGKLLKGLLAQLGPPDETHNVLPSDPRSLLAQALGVPVDQVHYGLKRGDLSGWDSLAHVALVSAVETTLNRQLSSREIEALASYRGLVQILDGALAGLVEPADSRGVDGAGEEVRLETVKVRDLYEFAGRMASAGGATDGVVPITPHRALAQVENPYADENDVGLIVAWVGDRCVGYRGLLPGRLKTHEGISKVYWHSTFYVLPEYRKQSVASLLMDKTFSLGHDLVATGMGQDAQTVYKGLGYRELGPLDFYILDLDAANPFRLLARLLRKIFGTERVGSGVAGSLAAGLERISEPVKKALYSLLLRPQRKKLSEVSWQRVAEVNDDDTPHHETVEFYRGLEIVNWMLRRKWVLEREGARQEKSGYYFSDYRDLFRHVALEVYRADNHEHKGFVVLSISSQRPRTSIRVLDFHVNEEADGEYAYSLALLHGREHGADTIQLPDNLAKYARASAAARLLLRKQRRAYLCWPKSPSSPLALSLDRIDLDYCDGDTAFT